MNWAVVGIGLLIGALHPLGGPCLAAGLLLATATYFEYKRRRAGDSMVGFALFVAILECVLLPFVFGIVFGAICTTVVTVLGPWLLAL